MWYMPVSTGIGLYIVSYRAAETGIAIYSIVYACIDWYKDE